MNFDKCTELYKHHCHKDIEFHHSENFPCASLLSLSFTNSLPLKDTDLISSS